MVHIIYDEQNKPIGWEMRPKTEEEQKVAGLIRDMQFFCFGDERIEYDGLKLKEPEKGKVRGNIFSLTWKKKNKRVSKFR